MYIYISIAIYIVAALVLATVVVPVIRYRQLSYGVRQPLQRYIQEWDRLRSHRVRVVNKEIEGSLYAYEQLETEKLAAIAYTLKSHEEQKNIYRSILHLLFKLALPALLLLLILVLASDQELFGLQQHTPLMLSLTAVLVSLGQLLAPICILLASIFVSACIQAGINRATYRLVSTQLPMAMDMLRLRQAVDQQAAATEANESTPAWAGSETSAGMDVETMENSEENE